MSQIWNPSLTLCWAVKLYLESQCVRCEKLVVGSSRQSRAHTAGGLAPHGGVNEGEVGSPLDTIGVGMR